MKYCWNTFCSLQLNCFYEKRSYFLKITRFNERIHLIKNAPRWWIELPLAVRAAELLAVRILIINMKEYIMKESGIKVSSMVIC